MHPRWYGIVTTGYYFVSVFKLDVHRNFCRNLFDIDYQLAAVFCHEVAADGHLITCGHIFFQHRIVLNTFRYEVISAGYYFISVFKLDVHSNFCRNLLDIDYQLAAVLCHEVAADGHLIAFRYILFQYRIVLYAARYCIISSGYYFISSFKLDIHSNICRNLLDVYYQLATFFGCKIAADGHLIAFRYILL